MAREINRRGFNKLLVSGAAAGATQALWPRLARAATEITVLNWQGYGTDEAWALKIFTEKTGIEVKHDYFNSEEEMLTKVRLNPGVYDVVVVNTARTKQLVAEGLLEPAHLDEVPNAAGLAPALREHSNLMQDGTPYGVAWLWGINGLAYREGKVPNADTFAVLSDPAYANRCALFDDAVTAVGVGALMTGQDINNPTDFEAIRTKLREMKPNVKLIWTSEDQWNKAFSAGEFDIAIYWSGASVRSRKTFGLPVVFVVPKEGAIGWLDSLGVPASSTKKEAARAFINYMIDPGFYVQWATTVGAPASANNSAMAALPADDLNKAIHKPEYLDKLQFMASLPDERRQKFLDLWEETKAFYAK
jgi:spermidine/putrescine transport system substrate-binding protein